MADRHETSVFRELLDHHGEAVMALLRRLCGNCHDADDLFQETAIRVWRGLHSRPWLRSPKAWLMTIAYRAFLDSRAACAKHEQLGECHDGRQADPATLAGNREEHRGVQLAVEQLPDPLRTVVVLHYTGGLSLRQVAAAMGISIGTAKSRLNNALERMRKALT